MNIIRASKEDAQEILHLQVLAYQSEAEIYNDYDLPPLKQTLEEMLIDIENQVILKAMIDDKIIGSVRAYTINGTCFIGRLIVHPDHQNQGIGSNLMRKIEKHFNTASRFELFTGHQSERNLYLYQKLGYEVFKKEKIHENLEIVFLQKLSI